ncbi:NUDIX domain-containing protein [Caldifermentibacillus hisashii]|uniref:bis(5'-nucleosyl)-tetraphosphatase n=1 Tax=Caldifermentibacillus hisashii TaxID=996558 RepID=UPI002DF7C65F|nr:NUDIX domain-containing protein [Caldifermentibacillus hisashii]MEC5273629.1 NUDIX domain-containing protein [Caldifermentibacillus hisashii]
MKREKSCGAIVFTSEEPHKVLLIKHQNGGHWAFPKGHVEEDETETETALREIAEETGLQVNLDTNFRKVVTYFPFGDVLKDVIYFLAYTKSTAIQRQLEEVSDAEWFPLSEAIDKVTFENDKIILKAAIDYIKKRK